MIGIPWTKGIRPCGMYDLKTPKVSRFLRGLLPRECVSANVNLQPDPIERPLLAPPNILQQRSTSSKLRGKSADDVQRVERESDQVGGNAKALLGRHLQLSGALHLGRRPQICPSAQISHHH